MSVFGTKSAKVPQLKNWPRYREAKSLPASASLSLTFSAGIIQIEKGVDIHRAEHAADILCRMAKRNKHANTFSVRRSVAKLEAELAKKKVKL